VLEFIAEAYKWFVDIVDAADLLTRRYRLFMSTSWPLHLILEIGTMAERGEPNLRLEDRLLEFYRVDNWRELNKLLESVCSYASIARHRCKTIRDVAKVMRAGEMDGFNAATYVLPRMFAELEGILVDYADADLDIQTAGSKTLTMPGIVKNLRPTATAIEKPALRLIANLLFKSRKNRPVPKGKKLHRHTLLHGRAIAPARRVDVVRIMLVIDAVAYLIDKQRDVQSQQVTWRTVYADFLSSSAKFAKLHQSLTALPAPVAADEPPLMLK
jgi:ribosomal protein L18E